MMLRTILLIIGVIIILAIAIDGWRRKRRHAQLSRALDPIVISKKTSIATSNIASHVPNETTVSPARTISATPMEKTPVTSRQQLEFPELDVSGHADEAISEMSETVPEITTATNQESRDIEIKKVNAPQSANDVTVSRPSIRPEQIKSANQVLPAHERIDNNPAKKVEVKMPDVITLTVMSINSKPFIGYDLINALEANNLHFGEMDIYHRHKYRNGKGPLYFSVASVVRPGTLDPKNLGVLSTPGLALFMQLDNPKHDRIIFKQMLATAHDLAKALNGVVCDERRVPLRESTIQGYNEKMNL